MQFLEFCMEVAEAFLAQRDNVTPEDHADCLEEGNKCPVKAVPHV